MVEVNLLHLQNPSQRLVGLLLSQRQDSIVHPSIDDLLVFFFSAGEKYFQQVTVSNF